MGTAHTPGHHAVVWTPGTGMHPAQMLALRTLQHRVYNLSDRQLGQAICEVPVHRSPVARLAWSADASMLACASRKGTVLRVLRMPQVGPCVAWH
jgi:hypothetical protein